MMYNVDILKDLNNIYNAHTSEVSVDDRNGRMGRSKR